jgi:hypothetical protein
MVQAMQEGREHRASGKLAYHVLEAMHAVARSSNEGRHILLSPVEL